jgi:predicted amidohydrolase
MPDEIVVAAACMKIQYDKEKNRGKILKFVEEASGKQAKLVVFPEIALQGYFWNAEIVDPEQKRYYYESAEPIPGPTTDILTQYAKRFGIFIQLGMAEKAPVGALYNSAVLVGPDGVVGVFRKVHEQYEDIVFNPGSAIPMWQTPLGNLGAIICYDLCFPEIVRIHALHGVDIVTMSTAWPMKGNEPKNDYYGYVYDLLAKANAMMNQIWLIQANSVGVPIGKPSKDNYYGHSRIISPLGQVVEEIGYEEGLVTAHVNVKDAILRARTEDFYTLNLIQDRRPELYDPIADTELYEQRFPTEHLPRNRGLRR